MGEKFFNPDLGKTLAIAGREGPREFYEGEIAKAILKTSQSQGGTMQTADLSEFSAEWVDPISIDYRGWKVYELPPNGQGWLHWKCSI